MKFRLNFDASSVSSARVDIQTLNYGHDISFKVSGVEFLLVTLLFGF